MPVTVRIPTPLRTLTGGKDQLAADPGTVRAIIDQLDRAHPGLRDRLCDAQGLRRFINLYKNDEDIRFLEQLETELKDGDSLTIVPAIAGGF